MHFIESILAAIAGFVTEPLSYITSKIVIGIYPTASSEEIFAHSNAPNDIAAGVLAALIIAWIFRAAVQIAVYVVSFAIGLMWAEMKSS
jgi:hypothetical protein